MNVFALLDDRDATRERPSSRLYKDFFHEHLCIALVDLNAMWARIDADLHRGLYAVLLAAYAWGAKLLETGHVKLVANDTSALRVLMLFRLTHLAFYDVDAWLAAQDQQPDASVVMALKPSVDRPAFTQAIDQIHESGRLTVRPIKGTAPRALAPQSDSETMLHTPGGLPHLARHLVRLDYSARVLGFVFDQAEALDAVRARTSTLHEPSRLRLALRHEGHLSLAHVPPPRLSGFEVRLIVAEQRLPEANPLAAHKTTLVCVLPNRLVSSTASSSTRRAGSSKVAAIRCFCRSTDAGTRRRWPATNCPT